MEMRVKLEKTHKEEEETVLTADPEGNTELKVDGREY